MMTDSAIVSSAVMGVCVILFLIDRIPMEVVAIGGCVLMVLLGASDFTTVFSQFSSSSIILLISLMIMGTAFSVTGMADYLITGMVRLSHGNERLLLVMSVMTCGLISAFMSNVATLAIFYSVFPQISKERIGYNGKRFMLPLAMASVVGGSCTLIGSAPQLSAQTFLVENGLRPFRVFSYFPVGVILLAVLAAYCALVGYPIGRRIWNDAPETDSQTDFLSRAGTNASDDRPIPKRRKILTVLIFAGTIILMTTGKVPLPIGSLMGVLLMLSCRCLSPEAALSSINWKGVLKLGGTLGLMKAFETGGGGALLGGQIVRMLNDSISPGLLLLVAIVVTILLSEVMTNTAAMMIVLPVVATVCKGYGFSVEPYVLAIVIASQAAVTTPLSNTPMMMATFAGYSFKDFLRHSCLWDLVAAVTIYTVIHIWYLPI